MKEEKEDRLARLMERVSDPLPNYNTEIQARNTRSVLMEGSSSELREARTLDLHSDQKSKKNAEPQSHKKHLLARKDDQTNQQTTLDNFNFYSVPVLDGKKVKVVHSDGEKIEEDSCSVSQNESSRGLKDKDDLVLTGFNQSRKMDHFFSNGDQSNGSASQEMRRKKFPPPEYRDFIMSERKEYMDKIERLERKLEDQNRVIDQKDAEIKRWRGMYNGIHTSMEAMIKGKNRIVDLALKLEDYRRQERIAKVESMKQRLGQTFIDSNTNSQYWMDGIEIREIKKKLQKLSDKRSKIENLKKNLNRAGKSGKKNAFDIESSRLNDDKDQDDDDEGLNTLISNTDPKEASRRLDIILQTQYKEEQDLREKLDELELEKNVLIQERRVLDEELK